MSAEYIKDPYLRTQLVRIAKQNKLRWSKCACGKPASEIDCEGAKVINRCKECYEKVHR